MSEPAASSAPIPAASIDAAAKEDGDEQQPLDSAAALSKHAQKKAARALEKKAFKHRRLLEQQTQRSALLHQRSLESLAYCRAVLKHNEMGFDLSAALPQRVLLLLHYSGTNYKGVQIQNRSTIPTVEGELLHALYRVGGISSQEGLTLHNLRWMRTARTDLGVHAAFNIVSAIVQLPPSPSSSSAAAAPAAPSTSSSSSNATEPSGFDLLKERVNGLLPPPVRVFDIMPIASVESVEQRLTAQSSSSSSSSSSPFSQLQPGDVCDFHAKNSCTGRTYEYLMPSAVWKTIGDGAVFSAPESASSSSASTAASSDSSASSSHPIPSVAAFLSAAPPSSSSSAADPDGFSSPVDLSCVPTRALHRLLKACSKR